MSSNKSPNFSFLLLFMRQSYKLILILQFFLALSFDFWLEELHLFALEFRKQQVGQSTGA